MAKQKKHEKAQKWKHFMSMWGNKYLSERRGKELDKRFNRVRFDISAFRKEVNRIIWLADHGPGFPERKRGEKCWSNSKGVHFSYRNMTYKIGLQSGVKFNKQKNAG